MTPNIPLTAEALGLQEEWETYVATLNWGPGSRDKSSWNALLRAATLRVPPDFAITKIQEEIRSTGGSISSPKLHSQQRRAYELIQGSQAPTTPSTTVVRSPKATFNPDTLNEFASKAPNITELWLAERSPINPAGLSSSATLEHLYHPGEKVLQFSDFYSQGQSLYDVGRDPPCETLQNGPNGVWYLVNPVSGLYFPNPRQEGRQSRRSEESVTSWRYLVLESDVAPKDQWLSALVQLPICISAIYTSGGKSIHALVRIDATSKQEWDTTRDGFKRILIPLGADEQAMTAVRLSRLPGAYRGASLQKLLYLNPNPQAQPIYPNESSDQKS